MITLQSHTSQVSRRYPHSPESHQSSLKKVSPLTKVTSVKSSLGIITHQGHISQVNANHYLVNSITSRASCDAKNRCHKPSWQGFRPPSPNGQCQNRARIVIGGASIISNSGLGMGLEFLCGEICISGMDGAALFLRGGARKSTDSK